MVNSALAVVRCGALSNLRFLQATLLAALEPFQDRAGDPSRGDPERRVYPLLLQAHLMAMDSVEAAAKAGAP